MHSVGSWFVENKEHCEAVERLVHYDSERHRHLREEIFEMKSKFVNRIQRIKQPDLRQCTERFSDHALKLFNARLSDAMNYKCECLEAIQIGVPCRHILCVLVYLGLSVYNEMYFHPHWARRFAHDPEEADEASGSVLSIERIADK